MKIDEEQRLDLNFKVRIAGVLLEGGALASTPSTDALLSWQGRGGVASDLFARLGSFKYQTPFHMPCQALISHSFLAEQVLNGPHGAMFP